MKVSVEFTTDAGHVLREAEAFLFAEPVLHNVMLTLLHARTQRPEPGRYWIARGDGAVRGVVLQSPLDFSANLSRLDPDAVRPLVDAVVAAGVALPGANGDAATAARFAGEWAERCQAPASPFRGQRIYEAVRLTEPRVVTGHLRAAMRHERDKVLPWLQAFRTDVGELGIDPERVFETKIEDGLLWLWDDEGPVSMAAYTEPVEGITRVQYVYTPDASRKRGYASACVFHLSKQLRDQHLRCMLFTDLANPTSNAVYRAIGYRAVAEMLQYRFDPPRSDNAAAPNSGASRD